MASFLLLGICISAYNKTFMIMLYLMPTHEEKPASNNPLKNHSYAMRKSTLRDPYKKIADTGMIVL
jgi:hypothetical protein